MTLHHVSGVSTGKDSQAILALGVAQEIPNFSGAFADTGNEHPAVYEHLEYLRAVSGVNIRTVRADFTRQIARKREYVREKWPEKGVPDWIVERALSILQPTGIPYLDLCLWKGRFPSRKAQFCTEELKVNPIIEQVFLPLLDAGHAVWSWQGVRAEESLARRYLPEFEEVGGGLFNYRPIIKWPASATFEASAYMGWRNNPLYTEGQSRVGCMPCINCGKDDLREIALRWPGEVDRIEEWERLVSMASKFGCATFFAAVTDPTAKAGIKAGETISPETHGIRRIVEWSKTSRGGREYDLIFSGQAGTGCSSSYGLCDGVAA